MPARVFGQVSQLRQLETEESSNFHPGRGAPAGMPQATARAPHQPAISEGTERAGTALPKRYPWPD